MGAYVRMCVQCFYTCVSYTSTPAYLIFTAIAEHVVMCAKQRRRAKKVKLLHKRHSTTCIKRLSNVQLSKSVEEKIGHTIPPQLGWATGRTPHACKIDKNKIIATRNSEKLESSSWRLGTPVKREIRQIYRTALEVKDTSVLLASENQPGKVADGRGENRKRIPTIFLSECHSSLCPETGVPEVPPVTPESGIRTHSAVHAYIRYMVETVIVYVCIHYAS